MGEAKDTMAHRYFYEGVAEGGCRRYSGQTLSFNRNCAVSYSTTIGIVVPGDGYGEADPHVSGSGILILSFDSMSSYTGRDINAVAAASPFPVMRAPMERGTTYYDPRTMRDLFVKRLAEYEKDLVHAKSREKFLSLMHERQRIMDAVCTEWAGPLRNKRLFSRFERIAADMDAYAGKLKERKRAEVTKREARKRAFLKKYAGTSGPAYNALVMSVYGDIERENPLKLTAAQRQEAREHLGGTGAYYCWLARGVVRTNHAIEIPAQEVRVALKAWAAGKDMRAVRVGGYAIVSYEGDTIQIGCHRLTRRNLLALYEVVVGKPFPRKAMEGENGCEEKAA